MELYVYTFINYYGNTIKNAHLQSILQGIPTWYRARVKCKMYRTAVGGTKVDSQNHIDRSKELGLKKKK